MVYPRYQPWGKSVSINLFGCDPAKISNPEEIKRFITEVIKVVDMVAHGPVHIDRFGDPKIGLDGYSAMQFIETSSITVHCDEPGRRCFVDIFSCKEFDAVKAESFSKSFFSAKRSNSTLLER